MHGSEVGTPSTTGTGVHGPERTLWYAGLKAAGFAAIVNSLLYGLASAGGFLPVATGDPNGVMTVGLGSVIAASVGASLIGTALFAVIRKLVRHPVAIMGLIGGVVLLAASFIPYLMAPGGIAGISPTNCGVAAVLELMHGITAIVTLAVLSEYRLPQ